MAKAPERERETHAAPDQRVEVTGGDLDIKEETGFYEAYRDFARNVRTWFIAYGIGGPVLFATSDGTWAKLDASGSGRIVVYCFLGGVVLQILGALLYKSAMWYLYMGELEKSFQKTKVHQIAEWFSEHYIVEAGIDVLTLVSFGVATIAALRVFVA